MTDEYATLRAAFHAGARIQAWHLICTTSNSNQGRWETLTPPEGREPEFGCEAHLYRVHPEDLSLIAELGQEVGAEQAPVAYMEPVTFNAASPADFAEALRKWPDDYDDWFPVYSSPAHTSEARDAIDAARYRFIAADRSAAWEEELDAAMRQEGE